MDKNVEIEVCLFFRRIIRLIQSVGNVKSHKCFKSIRSLHIMTLFCIIFCGEFTRIQEFKKSIAYNMNDTLNRINRFHAAI